MIRLDIGRMINIRFDSNGFPDSLKSLVQVTLLMLAAMHGKIDCVKKLIEANAIILMFDSPNGRTCLHYAAYYGHSKLSRNHSFRGPDLSCCGFLVGFSRFVNIRDGKGATPFNLAARQRRPQCVHILLDSGALVCASTGGYGYEFLEKNLFYRSYLVELSILTLLA
ncbi:putative ankyrin repeat-containing domain-containing protein [Helianthus anomalus]